MIFVQKIMSSIIKWKLQEKLSKSETNELLKELYYGSKKQLFFEINQSLDMVLYDLYSDFEDTLSGDFEIFFSNSKLSKPFISRIDFGDYTHKINSDCGDIFIYDFPSIFT